MRILYINYIDINKLLSGSSVRPVRIMDALRNTGHEIIALTGSQVDKSRKSNIKKIRSEIRKNPPDICYIESPTYPIMHHEDRSLIKELHEKNVPIGYFYRDFYRKFPEQFPRKKGLAGKIKDYGLDLLQYLTDRILKYCDIVYFPSIEATEFFSYKDMKPLPPAGENHIKNKKSVNHVGIYVGGVLAPYDSTLLLDSFMALHQQDPTYRLILVCRKEEWEKVDHPCKNESWLEVHHASGSELIPLYERASIAFVMPDSHFSYNQFAVSVKTFEYISYGLPVVAVNCRALKNMVEEEQIGLAIAPNVNSFVEAVKGLLFDQPTYDIWQEKVRKALYERNLWKHRVETIIDDLTKVKNKQ